jgi:thiol-disulfide isomerase/thioredoxin
MDAVVLVSKLVLALLFAVAAVAKLSEPTSFRRTLPLYGVPGRLAGAVGIAVPVAELVVAVTLVPAELARWGAIAALVLLAVFTGAAAVARARGVQAECDCFGPLDPLSTGARPFIRNTALAAIAALVAATETGAAATDISDSIVVGFALVAAALGTWLAISARKRGEQRTREAAVGTTAPASVFRALTGETIHLPAPDGTPTLLLFWNPSCPPCQYMLPRLKAWESDRPPGSPRLIIASSGSEDDNRATGLASPIVLERSDEARDAFAIPGRPAAVLFDGEGRVASEAILGAPAILARLGAPP